jgi:hypothetical protein
LGNQLSVLVEFREAESSLPTNSSSSSSKCANGKQQLCRHLSSQLLLCLFLLTLSGLLMVLLVPQAP